MTIFVDDGIKKSKTTNEKNIINIESLTEKANNQHQHIILSPNYKHKGHPLVIFLVSST